ncbi:hypothetical protein [Methylopila sp. M107]|uniref:SecDF P1 head subdomain-containing protein n=1 Tax=Methylopila sp. M107 TaxID=1101190 RepID=UPI00037B07CC|nr:hypothetical protein [Methylopila sp. M107]
MTRMRFAAAAAIVLAGATAAVAEMIRLHVSKAQPAFDQRTAEPVVAITLTPEGARAFGRFTAARVGETIHLRVGGKVMSSPRIMEPIVGGALQISGLDSVAAAQDLAVKIREGAATVEVEGSDK